MKNLLITFIITITIAIGIGTVYLCYFWQPITFTITNKPYKITLECTPVVYADGKEELRCIKIRSGQ